MLRNFALAFGTVFSLVGLLGFVQEFAGSGYLFGLFAVDPMVNIVHILSGGFAFFAVLRGSRFVVMYFKAFGVVYTLLTVAGLIGGTHIFGLMATNVWDNALHLLIAVLALWAGFGSREASLPYQR